LQDTGQQPVKRKRSSTEHGTEVTNEETELSDAGKLINDSSK